MIPLNYKVNIFLIYNFIIYFIAIKKSKNSFKNFINLTKRLVCEWIEDQNKTGPILNRI
jgi:hypothetical protein